MQFIGFLVLLFAININAARLPDQSLGLLSKVLGKKTGSPLILIVNSDGNVQSFDTATNKHRTSSHATRGSKPSFKASDQKSNSNSRLSQLRLLAKLLEGLKEPLRAGCGKEDSCEEKTPKPCETNDDPCEASDECENSCEPKCDVSTKGPEWKECKKPAQQCYSG
ncbi:uncharacterized protein LOC142984230 [Anticarsia gemmatalis]|uniref:uncharacterized protein LOC142984230 n=1 Tax=Anticarsia gemmatalis TaxID=129554 RepID=UPI003F771611